MRFTSPCVAPNAARREEELVGSEHGPARWLFFAVFEDAEESTSTEITVFCATIASHGRLLPACSRSAKNASRSKGLASRTALRSWMSRSTGAACFARKG